jgi:hypothetical protein
MEAVWVTSAKVLLIRGPISNATFAALAALAEVKAPRKLVLAEDDDIPLDIVEVEDGQDEATTKGGAALALAAIAEGEVGSV